jgi:glycosyltransferase involved in cell wall biosynthesis
MRVLLANGEPGFRGGEHQTIALARGLAARGCEVAIACRAGAPTAARAALEAIECRTFAFERWPARTPAALARFISLWRPGVCHALTAGAHTHLWLARAAVPSPPPLVVSRRVAFGIPPTPFSLLKYRRGVAHFIPISRAAAESLARIGVPAGKMTIVPSGVDTARFARPEGGAARRAWGVAADEFVIGSVAAFEAEKGLATLVDAAAAMRSRGLAARFVLVGDGSLGPRLAERAARAGLGESVILARRDRPLEETLGAFDLFALPSLEEGLSTALLAAMAAGLAVVASETGGIPEAVSPECAILVPPGDAESLAAALARLMERPDLRARMGEAGRARAARFDISATVERTLEIYREVAGARLETGS